MVLLAAVTLAGCRATPDAAPRIGDQAPGFALPAVGGGEVALADYAGVQPVLLFFHMAVG
jgi:peroxiredoxin